MRKWRVCLWRQGARNVETIAADTMAVDGGVLYFFYYDRMGLRYGENEWVYVESAQEALVYPPRFYNQTYLYNRLLANATGETVDTASTEMPSMLCPLVDYVQRKKTRRVQNKEREVKHEDDVGDCVSGF